MDGPRFNLRLPLALDDPAFSQDPRSHPLFDARSFKHVPPIPPKPLTVLKPVTTNIPRKARMKALVRRLTTRHNLDPIDELDETDPFGSSYHHDGPYEAIGNNLTHRPNTATRKSNNPAKRDSDPLPLRPGRYHSASRVPYGHTGLSLRLEPGQILQPNTIYSAHAIPALPGRFLPRPNSVPITRPYPSRRQLLPNTRSHSHEDSPSVDPRRDIQNAELSSLRTPRERSPRHYTLDVSNSPALHNDRDAAAYAHTHHQPQKIVLPPPRYESRFHSSPPPRSPQRTPPPSYDSTSPNTLFTENAVLAQPRPDFRHKTLHSLDSSHTINNAFTPSSSSLQNKPLDPLRVRHLPKRLVMPAPLQPQQPQSHHNFSPSEPSTWQEEDSDNHGLYGAHFEGKPAMYSKETRLLRKKSSAFPAKAPIPDHAPASQDVAVLPTIGNPSSGTGNEVDGTKERTRRRRLSKRKNDV